MQRSVIFQNIFSPQVMSSRLKETLKNQFTGFVQLPKILKRHKWPQIIWETHFALPQSDTFSSTSFLSPWSLSPIISCLKSIFRGEIYISIKLCICRFRQAYFNVLIFNFYYYKNCNELKLSISLWTKKVRQIFVHLCYRIATQAVHAK